MKNFGYLCAVSVAVIAQSAAAQTPSLTTITGEVISSVTFEAAYRQYTLTMKSGVSYTITSSTKILIKGAPPVVSNLKVGMTCTLQYANLPQGNYISSLSC